MSNELLFLVGYMGSGKSTIGKLLATRLDRKFLDLDDLIELINNNSITNLFNQFGEEYFREKETQALHQLKGKHNLVIATGGGCAASGNNMHWMNDQGTTIYLRCHPGVLFHRIAPEKKKRPLLSGMEDVDIMEYMVESLKKRLPFYIQARHTVNGDSEPEQVVASILKSINGVPTNFSQD